MKTRRLLPVLALLALFPGWADARPLDAVRAAGTLRLVVYRDFPPFSEEAGGRPRGVDIDLARAIAERLGVKPEIVVLTADESVDDDLRNGVWKGPKLGGAIGDVMLHVPYDRALEIRNEHVVLFAPYHREELVVARRGETPSLAALGEERIGVEVDSISDLYLSGVFGGRLRDKTRRYVNLRAAAAALQSGEATALMGPRSEVEAVLGDKRRDYVVSVPHTPNLDKANWPLGTAVKEDSRDLGYAVEDIVAAMLADGTLAAIFGAHGITHKAP